MIESLLKHYRLTMEEYELMKKGLGHEPSQIEWAVYSALWSEHCSYKSSKVHLRKLYTKHPRVAQGPGENAGVIDLGKGEMVAFKMESHNHPSFIEPTQGAATGVGGILRDIFTMGARPIASMDYLCFGEPENHLIPKLLSGVVKGIGGYGNCVGVPTVSGQTSFHPSYNNNNLVNAFSVGLFSPGEKVFYGRARGVGNLIVYAGARTGRDGVHGAAMASESFNDDIEKKKPNVQIGDPFFEKLLIEACLEVMKEDLIVGIQDMGAAGLTSSTFEMASRAQSGLKIDLKKVPLREPDITPEEILLSESQERMILIVEPKNLNSVAEKFRRWDLECTPIGEIVSGDQVELFWGDKCLARVSHKPLVEDAPVYERPYDLKPIPRPNPIEASDPESIEKTLVEFLSHPQMSSREWITRQYDQRVGARTIKACDDYVAQLRLPSSGRVLGMTTGCRPLLMEWHPYIGGQDAIVLPVLQLASRGIEALAVTDCLNFGNPEKKEVMGEFVAAVKGLDGACRAFEIPIISGNVSLYNETGGVSIVGTPATGIVGLKNQIIGPEPTVTEKDLALFLVRTKSECTWLGEYSQIIEKKPTSGLAQVDLNEVIALQKACLKLSETALSSQVIGKGGLISALYKMASSGVGLSVDYFEQGRGIVEFLFAERFYASIWAVRESDAVGLLEVCRPFADLLNISRIGKTEGQNIRVNHYLEIAVDSLKGAHQKGWRGLIEKMA